MTQEKKPANPVVYVGLTLAAVVALWLAWSTFATITKKPATSELDRSIEQLREAREKNK